MPSAYLVLGHAVCFDPKLFQEKARPEECHDSLGPSLQSVTNGKKIGFALCFETDDQLQARRWAIQANMQLGSRVVKIKEVIPSMTVSTKTKRYAFIVNDEIIAREPYPIPTINPES